MALCLHCGMVKRGAFQSCGACGHQPRGREDLARHMLLTDWFYSATRLEEIAAAIRSGSPVSFNPQLLECARARLSEWFGQTAEGRTLLEEATFGERPQFDFPLHHVSHRG